MKFRDIELDRLEIEEEHEGSNNYSLTLLAEVGTAGERMQRKVFPVPEALRFLFETCRTAIIKQRKEIAELREAVRILQGKPTAGKAG